MSDQQSVEQFLSLRNQLAEERQRNWVRAQAIDLLKATEYTLRAQLATAHEREQGLEEEVGRLRRAIDPMRLGAPEAAQRIHDDHYDRERVLVEALRWYVDKRAEGGSILYVPIQRHSDSQRLVLDAALHAAGAPDIQVSNGDASETTEAESVEVEEKE